jgi:hypothetical protein
MKETGQQDEDVFKIIHGDDLEIFINNNQMITIKTDDYGAGDMVVSIHPNDVDKVCEILQHLKKEISK